MFTGFLTPDTDSVIYVLGMIHIVNKFLSFIVVIGISYAKSKLKIQFLLPKYVFTQRVWLYEFIEISIFVFDHNGEFIDAI